MRSAAPMFGGVSSANRSYSNAKGDSVEVSISGDNALLTQFAPMMNNPAMAAMMGKLIRIGSQRAIQNQDGDIIMVVANKFLINVQGSRRCRQQAGLCAGHRRRQAVEDVVTLYL